MLQQATIFEIISFSSVSYNRFFDNVCIFLKFQNAMLLIPMYLICAPSVKNYLILYSINLRCFVCFTITIICFTRDIIQFFCPICLLSNPNRSSQFPPGFSIWENLSFFLSKYISSENTSPRWMLFFIPYCCSWSIWICYLLSNVNFYWIL